MPECSGNKNSNTMSSDTTTRIDLGILDLGNNHCTRHLMAEIASSGKAEQLLEQLGDMPAHADVELAYGDKFRAHYAEVWDVGELYDNIAKAATE